MKYRNLIFLVFLLFCLSYGRDVIFVGLSGEGAPAIEKTYDRLLREQLSVTQDIQLADYIQSQRYKNMIHFEKYPVVSKDLVESMAKYVRDTSFFVWGTVKVCKVAPSRHLFFHARLHGELQISLNMYSFSDRAFAYSGTINAEQYKSIGIASFTPIAESFHVSALDQTDMIEKLEFEAVKKTCEMISAVVRSEISRNGANVDVGKYEVKAVNEVLTMPSVQAPEVKKGPNESKAADSTPPVDTAKVDTAGKTSAGSKPLNKPN